MNPSPSESELAAGSAESSVVASDDVSADSDIDAGNADGEILRLRALIDEVDATIVATVQQRIALSKQIQAVRMAHGGRRREHSREIKIVNTYADGLGRGGNQLALTLLELCRGRV